MSLSALTTLVTPMAGGRDTGVADQGNFYSAITPTPGTGIISSGSVSAFTQTTPYLLLVNLGNLNIYPMHWRMHTTVVGTSNTNVLYTFVLDSTNRFTSGGTALTVSNTNMVSSNKSGAQIYVGAITATAASANARVVSHHFVKAAIEVVHDCVNFNFGGPEQVDPASFINNTTTLSHYTANIGPLVVGPGQSLVVVRWGASAGATGVTLENEFAFMEK